MNSSHLWDFWERKSQLCDDLFLPSPRRRFLLVGSRITNHRRWVLHGGLMKENNFVVGCKYL